MQAQAHQQKVIDLVKEAQRPVVWTGAVRAGKTIGALLALISEAQATPDTYVLAGYTYGSIERNMLSLIPELLEGVEYTLSKRYPYKICIGDSTIYCIAASDEASHKALQGMTVRGAVVDEAFLTPQSFIMQLVARLSQETRWLLLTGNKVEPDHWIKTEWIDNDLVEVIESGLDDNAYLCDDAKSWYTKLITGPWGKRMVKNEWAGPANPVCRVQALPMDSDIAEVLAGKPSVVSTFVDFSDQTYRAFVARLSDEEYFVCDTTETEPELLITNMVQKGSPGRARMLVNSAIKTEIDAATALAEKTIFVKEIEGTTEKGLSNLYWRYRGKPCRIPSAVMAVAQAVALLDVQSRPFAKAGSL